MTPHPVITAVGRLADVLERENSALKVMDLARAAGLLSEKSAALDMLAASGGVPPGLRDPSIMATARQLDSLLQENRQLLERAIVAQQRVIGIIVRAATGARAMAPSYGARGRSSATALPLALFTRA